MVVTGLGGMLGFPSRCWSALRGPPREDGTAAVELAGMRPVFAMVALQGGGGYVQASTAAADDLAYLQYTRAARLALPKVRC